MTDPCDNNPQLQSTLNRASKDKFTLVLNLPYVLREMAKTNSKIDIKPLQLSVHGTLVPQISIPPVDLGYAGQHLNVSSHARPNYQPIDLSFVVDNRFYNYWIIWKWLDVLNTARESTYGGTRDELMVPREVMMSGTDKEYQSTISLFSLDEYNNKIIEFRYFNAFPINLNPLQLSYREQEMLEASCSFQFNQLDVILL